MIVYVLCVCMCVSMYMSVYVNMYGGVGTCLCVCVCMIMCVCMCECIHVCACSHVCEGVGMCGVVCVSVHVLTVSFRYCCSGFCLPCFPSTGSLIARNLLIGLRLLISQGRAMEPSHLLPNAKNTTPDVFTWLWGLNSGFHVYMTVFTH